MATTDSNCKKVDDWNANLCKNDQQWAGLSIESLEKDRLEFILGPVNITNDEGYFNPLSLQMDKKYNGYDISG